MIISRRKTLSVALWLSISACGGSGGSGGDNGISNDPVTTTGACANYLDYFASLSGERTGIVSEAVAPNSMCVFEVTMTINNDPDPLINCRTTGSLSFTGSQMIVDDVNPASCASRVDVPLLIGQSIPFIAQPDSIDLPTRLTLLVMDDLPAFDVNGMRINYPVAEQQVITLTGDLALSIDGGLLVQVESNPL